jgi:hypothetical protein
MIPVPDWPDYFVTNDGEVWSTKGRQPRKLKPWVSASGHAAVALSRRNPAKTSTKLVHALVLTAYRGPRPDGHEACHSDGNAANNTLDNLRWDTRLSNVQDAIRHQTFPRGAKCRHAKLTEAQVIEIRAKYVRGVNGYKRLARDYGVKWQTICAVVSRRTWGHL